VATAMITSKGQITIPKSVRTKLKLEAGHRVEFIENGCGAFSSNRLPGIFDLSRGFYPSRGGP